MLAFSIYNWENYKTFLKNYKNYKYLRFHYTPWKILFACFLITYFQKIKETFLRCLLSHHKFWKNKIIKMFKVLAFQLITWKIQRFWKGKCLLSFCIFWKNSKFFMCSLSTFLRIQINLWRLRFNFFFCSNNFPYIIFFVLYLHLTYFYF